MRSVRGAFRQFCAAMAGAVIAGGAGLISTVAQAQTAWVPAYLSSPCAPIVGLPAEVIPPPQEIAATRPELGAHRVGSQKKL